MFPAVNNCISQLGLDSLRIARHADKLWVVFMEVFFEAHPDMFDWFN